MNLRFRLISPAVLVVVAAYLVSCGGSTENPGSDEGKDLPQVDSGVDSGTEDTAQDTADTSGTDTPDYGQDIWDRDGEVTDDTGEERCPGGLLCECETTSDCYSGLCVETNTSSVCSNLCSLLEDDCPQGWDCRQVNLGAEAVYGCVYPYPNLCKPCKTNEECAPKAGAGDDIYLCVEFGPEGSYCSAECARDTDCPDGYECEDVPFASDFVKQCLPVDGICPCSAKFLTKPDVTSCYVENEFGTCTGERTCESACSADTPVSETCNHKDDDCDGATDEDVPPEKCPITNAQGTCWGKAYCINGSLSNCDGDEPEIEVCNGRDDNCDGRTDEGYPDEDIDGIANCVDPDIDGDGIVNVIDNCSFKKNPGQENNDIDEEEGVEIEGDACDTDDDNDGIPDVSDNCPKVKNPGLSNIDGDEFGDACDCDLDGDGKHNPAYLDMLGGQCTVNEDNCPGVANPGQENIDFDNAGDACDCDIDADGIANNNPGCTVVTGDNCPYDRNQDQLDANFNGKGDACDCDADSDTVPNNNPGCPVVTTPDNCTLIQNLSQRDMDHDGTGDACDCDIDDDEVMNNNTGCPLANPEDNCPYTFNPDQDPIHCDDDWDGDGVKNPEDNCPYYPNPLQEDGDIDTIGDVCDCDADSDGIKNSGVDQNDAPCVFTGKPDNCPLIANAGQDNLDNDALGDACDCDIDGDGHDQAGFGCPTPADPDCEPFNPAISKNASEKCNSIDDNCNGQTDEAGALGCTTYYYDNDNDTYGSTDFRCQCAASGKYRALRGGDCDDNNPNRNPGVQETCNNGVDDNCNGSENDENSLSCTNYYFDGDSDNYGTNVFKCLCSASGDYRSKFTGDCDDNNPGVNPAQKEICFDNKDNDCTGSQNDIQSIGCKNFYFDQDNDAYGTADTLCLCFALDMYRAEKTGDCNDFDNAVNPGLKEVCNNEKDDNCDGVQDTQNADRCINYFYDGDNDNYGANGTALCLCNPDATHTATVGNDCKDSNAQVNPGATEVCNNVDDNCSGATDENPTALCPSNETLHSAMTCIAGECQVSGCNAGWFDVNGSSTDGCECAQDTNDNTANSCTTAIDLGAALSDASTSPTITRVGKIVPNSDIDWYKVTATDTQDSGTFASPGHDKFNVRAWLERPTDGSIAIEVHAGSCSTAATCGGSVTEYQYNVATTDKANLVGQGSCINSTGLLWECCAPGECGTDAGSAQNACCGSNTVCQGSTNPYNMRECGDDTKTFYIKVFRASGSAATCGQTEYELRITNGK